MSVPESFSEALIYVYRENPCEVLPNALWKSSSWVDQFETDFTIEDGIVEKLVAWKPNQLMLFWMRDRGGPTQVPANLGDTVEFALLHHDFVDLFNMEEFSQRQLYFRMIHKMGSLPEPNRSIGYFTAADPLSEAQNISDLIVACYEDIHPCPVVVQGWREHPVFDPDLWIWIHDENNDTPIGLGIAEFDPLIAEGSLEWIQVLPNYRGRGFGKSIVCELLRRLEGMAEFVTVAGLVDNDTQPEMLYRSCGFEGDDKWWVLRK